MKFIKKHKNALIVIVICIILIILAATAIYKMFYPNSNIGDYDYRFTNVPDVDNAVISKIKDEILELDIVDLVSSQLSTQSPIIKFYVSLTEDGTTSNAQDITNIILDNFSSDIIKNYDIEVYFEQESKTDFGFPMIGYHSKKAEEFSYVMNQKDKEEIIDQGEDDEE